MDRHNQTHIETAPPRGQPPGTVCPLSPWPCFQTLLGVYYHSLYFGKCNDYKGVFLQEIKCTQQTNLPISSARGPPPSPGGSCASVPCLVADMSPSSPGYSPCTAYCVAFWTFPCSVLFFLSMWDHTIDVCSSSFE